MKNEFSASQIKDAVCRVCGIGTDDIYGRSRRREITDARKIIAHLLFEKRVCITVADVSRQIGLCRNSGYKALAGFEELVRYDASFRSKFICSCRVLGIL